MVTKKRCAFWSCDEEIRANYVVCREHYPDYADDNLDECPSCGRLKDATYPQCLRCKDGQTPKRAKGFFGRIADAVEDYVTETKAPKPKTRSRKPQTSAVRNKSTQKPTASSRSKTRQSAAPVEAAIGEDFYVYILELDGDNNRTEYYVGQTNNLRARKREHERGTAITTQGRNPKLVWFSAVRTRAEAEAYEKHLQDLALRNNGRAITNMIIQFEDLVRALDNPGLARN